MSRREPNPFRGGCYGEHWAFSGDTSQEDTWTPSSRWTPGTTATLDVAPPDYEEVTQRHSYRYADYTPPTVYRGASLGSASSSFPTQDAAFGELPREFDQAWLAARWKTDPPQRPILQPTPIHPPYASRFLDSAHKASEHVPDTSASVRDRAQVPPHTMVGSGVNGHRSSQGGKRGTPAADSCRRSLPNIDTHRTSHLKAPSCGTWKSETTLVPDGYDDSLRHPDQSTGAHRGQSPVQSSNNLHSMSAGSENKQFWRVIQDELMAETNREFDGDCVMKWNNRGVTLVLPLTSNIAVRITKRLSQPQLKDPLTALMGRPVPTDLIVNGKKQPLVSVLKSRGQGQERLKTTSIVKRSGLDPDRWVLQPKIEWPMRSEQDIKATTYVNPKGLAATYLETQRPVKVQLLDVDLAELLRQPETEVCFTEEFADEIGATKSRHVPSWRIS